MSNLREVCLLSCEKWVDSFPCDIPNHEFSKKHNEKMQSLLQNEPKKHRLSRKTITFILIAAIIMAVATTVFAITSCREFILKQYSSYSEYYVPDAKNSRVETLKVNYVPDGFEKNGEYEEYFIYRYSNVDNSKEYFEVHKVVLNAKISFDSKKYESENIYINGIEGIYFSSDDEKDKGIVFNNGKYIFIVKGNIDKQTLIEIAQNVEWLFVKEADFYGFFLFLSQNKSILG